MNKLNQAMENISFSGPGEYGIHDGFFNAITTIDGIDYDFQCCADEKTVYLDDLGHDWGMCGDANAKLAAALSDDESEGYEMIKKLIIRAIEIYLN